MSLTIDEQLDDIERLLITSIHRKASEGEQLNSYELQLVTRWLKSRDASIKPKKPKKPKEPIPEVMSGGDPLPFILKKETLEEAMDAYDE